MTLSFGPVAAALAGLAARRLGWRPDEFWRATPCELGAALGHADEDTAAPLAREDLERMMEHDHG